MKSLFIPHGANAHLKKDCGFLRMLEETFSSQPKYIPAHDKGIFLQMFCIFCSSHNYIYDSHIQPPRYCDVSRVITMYTYKALLSNDCFSYLHQIPEIISDIIVTSTDLLNVSHLAGLEMAHNIT